MKLWQDWVSLVKKSDLAKMMTKTIGCKINLSFRLILRKLMMLIKQSLIKSSKSNILKISYQEEI